MCKRLILLVASIATLILFSACNSAPIDSATVGGASPTPAISPAATPKATQSTPAPLPSAGDSSLETIGVIDLYNEFVADVPAATSKYEGKSIVATGLVTRTGPDIHGTPSVELSDAEGGKVYVLYVVNSFDQLDEVAVGETVTMKGNFHVFSSGDWGVVIKQGEVLEKV